METCQGDHDMITDLETDVLNYLPGSIDTEIAGGTEGAEEGEAGGEKMLIYGVEDVPSPHLTFLIGLQQVALSISGSIAIPLIVSELICLQPGSPDTAKLVSTFLLMCGVSTLLQCSVGVRLPILQGGCAKFIPAVASLMALDRLRCQPDQEKFLTDLMNTTNSSVSTSPQGVDMHHIRLREIQGGILLASLTEVLVACSGLLGVVLHYIGPLTIMPTITLIGFSLVDVVTSLCEVNWGITVLTVGLVLLFSLYLNGIDVPVPSYEKGKGVSISWSPLFKLFPVVLAVAVSWTLCAILTVTGVFTDNPEDKGFRARSDGNVVVLHRMPWFYMPYPGQWGIPSFGLTSFLAMLAATMASLIESIGDYYACARMCGLPAPPAHAMNRGIAMEGLGGILAGLYGSGGSTTSFSQNVGAIGFTKAGSRRAFQVAGLIFVFCGVFGKFGAVMTMMPTPILGAILMVSLGMVSAVGLSNLQFVDMRSSRNQCIIGLSLMLGMVLPSWSVRNPNAIQTGSVELDQSIKVLIQTSMFVGGMVAFILDNTVPGTKEKRGIKRWKEHVEPSAGSNSVMRNTACRTYDLPFVTKWLEKKQWARFIPILPTFDENIFNVKNCKCRPFCKQGIDATHV